MPTAAFDVPVRLLFVCTGNMCRSAAADRLMSAWSAAAGSVEVRSAGTQARPGRAMHPRTERALERHGVAAENFASRRLTEDDVEWADLVLTMTSGHREEVVALSPRGLRKVFTLLEAAGLIQTLPTERLRADARGLRGPHVAEALGEARSRHAKAHGPDFDIVDPIDGPNRLHVEVVDQIAHAVQALVEALATPVWTEQTVRMHRIPPVPRPV